MKLAAGSCRQDGLEPEVHTRVQGRAGSLYDAAVCCDVDAVQRMIADGADVEKSPVSRELEEIGARGGVWRV